MDKRKTIFTAVVMVAGIDEQIENIQEEIGSVYEHFEELSKDKEDGR